MDASVGYLTAELAEAGTGTPFPMSVMYPTTASSAPQRLGPFSLDLAIGAEPLPGKYPLVVVSHGSGGSPLTHRLLARHLAANGVVVGLPEHPGNNRNDNALADTIEILERRPGHLATAADWFFGGSPFAGSLTPGSYAVVGHSLGGYTALALAGGVPSTLPRETGDDPAQRIEVAPDPRVSALVLLAPATPWFSLPGALAAVRTPILLLAGEKDEICPTPWMPRVVVDGVPAGTPVEYRVVDDAGHFSFLSPWPEAMTSPAFPPSQDPHGFDRHRFVGELNDAVLGFLRERS